MLTESPCITWWLLAKWCCCLSYDLTQEMLQILPVTSVDIAWLMRRTALSINNTAPGIHCSMKLTAIPFERRLDFLILPKILFNISVLTKPWKHFIGMPYLVSWLHLIFICFQAMEPHAHHLAMFWDSITWNNVKHYTFFTFVIKPPMYFNVID